MWSYFANRFLKRLNSTREATPPEKPEPEPFLEEPEPAKQALDNLVYELSTH
jgi:hypothetical protein